VLALFALPLPMDTATGDAEPGQQASSAHFDPKAEAEMVALLNRARSEYGLPPLPVDQRLTEAARKHSTVMAEHSAIGHHFEGEPPLQIRISNEGLPADTVSENVALSNRDAAAAHEGLMHSPPHRAAILNAEYNTVGVGVLRQGNYLWVSEEFARKLPELSNSEAESAAQAAVEQYARRHGFRAPSRRTELQLRPMACSMARKDKLESGAALRLPGVAGVLAWTANDPGILPKGISEALSRETSQDALGACFAPSASHPGGVYWIVMVTYF
jgi:uncharacterized protein YkwD